MRRHSAAAALFPRPNPTTVTRSIQLRGRVCVMCANACIVPTCQRGRKATKLKRMCAANRAAEYDACTAAKPFITPAATPSATSAHKCALGFIGMHIHTHTHSPNHRHTHAYGTKNYVRNTVKNHRKATLQLDVCFYRAAQRNARIYFIPCQPCFFIWLVFTFLPAKWSTNPTDHKIPGIFDVQSFEMHPYLSFHGFYNNSWF